MPVQSTITCPSCQTKLGVAPDLGPPYKVKCPKCGQVIDVPMAVAAPRAPAAIPALTRPTTPWLERIPLTSIPPASLACSLLSLVLAIFLRLYVLGLVVACCATLASAAGCVLLVRKKQKVAGLHLAGVGVGVLAFLLALNNLLLRASLERNEALQAKNETMAARAKADLDDAKKKLAEADEAPRKAALMLKQAEQAPREAEAFYKKARDVRDRAEAAEKKAADLMVRAEALDKKNEVERARVMEVQVKQQELQKKLDDERKDLADLQKKVEANQTKADQKIKEAQDLFKKVENALKGALLDLKSPKAEARLKAARVLGKLADCPLPEDTGSKLCELVATELDAKVKAEGVNALKSLLPDIHPYVAALAVLPENPDDPFLEASAKLARMGKEARPATPIILHQLQSFLKAFAKKPDNTQLEVAIRTHLNTLAEIAPDDPAAVQAIGQGSAFTTNPDKAANIRFYSFAGLAAVVKADTKMNKLVLPFLVAGLKDKEDSVKYRAIYVLEKMGPGAKEAAPKLRELQANPNDGIRQAALKALKKIEMAN